MCPIVDMLSGVCARYSVDDDNYDGDGGEVDLDASDDVCNEVHTAICWWFIC